MMVDTGIVGPLVHLLDQTARTRPQAASLTLKALATILASSSTDAEVFPGVCASIISAGGVPVVARYIVAAAEGELAHSYEWAVAVLYELSTNGTITSQTSVQ